jgi:uncharacterized membrane protein YphA (DoxX/SURF4 family)
MIGPPLTAQRKAAQRCRRSRIFTPMELVTSNGPSGMDLLRLAFASMLAILFLQSSMDKIINWKGEQAYLTGHFAKSPLKGTVPLLLPVVTIIELSAGSCSLIGFFTLLLGHGTTTGLLGMLLGTKAIVLLFFGQRIAKDYAGAASLIPYFLMCAAGIYVFAAF